MPLRAVCVFCGSHSGIRPGFALAARQLGAMLAGADVTLIFGGGRVGLMGAVADGCLQAGGRAIGVIPRALLERELGHTGLTQLHVVDSMHARKARMVELAQGFLALPGGMGTFDELFEALTWAQLGIHANPIAVINIEHYFDPLLALVDQARQAGFVDERSRALLRSCSTVDAALDVLWPD
ncbi:MAG TPA: TIGR00730 family Rossman fold protein [Steroidobacteraceae bacterium]|mgnify:CR=1 FL=1|nr:TIGR00730 family Rossman fold protein [Steroidobacteraceae bacterium]